MIARLVESLRALADSTETHRISLVAQDFADAYLLVCDCPQMLLTPQQQRILTDLDLMLETAPDPAAIRAAARRALAALGEN
jgi:hypothetical protein